MIVPGRGAGMADWQRFLIGLGEQFFEAMKAALVTETHINKPPRKRLNSDGSAKWSDPVGPLNAHAHVGIMPALHGAKPIPEYNSSKERHWGRRKLKRDE